MSALSDEPTFYDSFAHVSELGLDHIGAEHVKRALGFLRSIGIRTRMRERVEGFLLGPVDIDDGVIVWSWLVRGLVPAPHAEIVGDMLHEAGHLAVLPQDVRPHLTFDVDESMHTFETALTDAGEPDLANAVRTMALVGSEAAATCWAYAAAIHLGIDPKCSFDLAYEEEASGRIERLECESGRHQGIENLKQLGLVAEEGFPKLASWTVGAAGLDPVKTSPRALYSEPSTNA